MGATSRVIPHSSMAPHGEADPDPAREARLEALLRAWWREERPAWTEESWWDTTLHEDVRRLLWLAPGPRLAAALAELTPDGPCPVPHAQDRLFPDWPTPGHAPGWPCACHIITAAAWEACASWLAARSAAALVRAAGAEEVEFDVGDGRQRIHDPAREELAHALRTSIPAMGNRIGAARALTSHPRLVTLVESAAISAWAGRLILDHVTDLGDQDADKVIEDVASRIHHRLATGRRPYHSGEVNRLARAARLRVCPETSKESRVRAFGTRRVIVHPGGNGMATLIADLAEVDAHRVHRRLTAIASGLQADATADGTAEPRTRDQLRADILTDLLIGPHHDQDPPTPAVGSGPRSEVRNSGPVDATSSEATESDPRNVATPRSGHPVEASRPDIQVIVTLETLIGLADDAAEVIGIGPIPADVARALAADGIWRAWVTDAAGIVTSTGTRGYVPSASLARLVRAREPHCRFPGCRQPALRCDLDHAVPWPRGATTAANLGPLCRRHHGLKTHTPWSLDLCAYPDNSAEGGSGAGWQWRTPAGFVITDGPEPPLRTHLGPSGSPTHDQHPGLGRSPGAPPDPLAFD
jgi:hypothetical protein